MGHVSSPKNLLNSIKLSISVEKSSAYNHQSVGSVKRMVQTIKQIMNKNAENAWLAMLIFRATDIPGINKSPSEILNGRKFRTNLPMIDICQMSSEAEIESLAEKRLSKGTKDQELSRLPVGTPILYNSKPDSTKIKHPTWLEGTVKDRLNGRKYEILTDGDREITRSRRHIKAIEHDLDELLKSQIDLAVHRNFNLFASSII